MLEGAKRAIFVVATQNEIVIVAKRRCNITFEDFWSVHAVGLQQLATTKEALEVVQRSMVNFSM